jgi:hypothetical protein
VIAPDGTTVLDWTLHPADLELLRRAASQSATVPADAPLRAFPLVLRGVPLRSDRMIPRGHVLERFRRGGGPSEVRLYPIDAPPGASPTEVRGPELGPRGDAHAFRWGPAPYPLTPPEGALADLWQCELDEYRAACDRLLAVYDDDDDEGEG